MRHKFRTLVALGFGLYSLASTAFAVTIDFETLPGGGAVLNGQTITNQYAPWGVTFGSIHIPGAVQTTTIIPFPTSGQYSLAPNGPAPYLGGTLTLSFSTPVDYVGSFVIDTQRPIAITAFDSSGNIVQTTSADNEVSGYWQIAYSPGISEVQMVGGQISAGNFDGWGMDDLTFTQVVPIPATAWLFSSAVGVMGVMRRKRAS